jgi:hypothetical protein
MTRKANTEKISVTLPRELIRQIRALVSRGEVSSFFTQALEHFLAIQRQKISLNKGFGAWGKESRSDLLTPEDSVSYVRSLREKDSERLLRVREQRGK